METHEEQAANRRLTRADLVVPGMDGATGRLALEIVERALTAISAAKWNEQFIERTLEVAILAAGKPREPVGRLLAVLFLPEEKASVYRVLAREGRQGALARIRDAILELSVVA